MPTPTYKIEAISMKANKESPPEWLGSDEPYFVWTSTTLENPANLKTVMSQKFEDVDSGESRVFSSPVLVAGGAVGLALNTVVVESDKGNREKVRVLIAETLKSIDWGTMVFQDQEAVDNKIKELLPDLLRGKILDAALKFALEKALGPLGLGASFGDDMLAVRSVVWPASDLTQLASPGATVDEAISYKGSARYTVTYRGTRLMDRPDGERPTLRPRPRPGGGVVVTDRTGVVMRDHRREA